MRVKAYCKINLGLNILNRREDGYHELKMIMVPITLHDILDIGFSTRDIMSANRSFIPTDERNSVIKVLNGLRERYGFQDRFSISLIKNTPTQAGLGGGSSDAAEAIKLFNTLLDLKMSTEEMEEFGKGIGADVPFFIQCRPALVSGIGEKLYPFTIRSRFHLLLVKPKKGVNTKLAYQSIDYSALRHPDIDGIREALERDDYDRFLSLLDNDLEQAACLFVPEIETVKKELVEAGMDAAVMSGSGSTVIGISRDRNVRDAVFEKMKGRYPFVKKTAILEQ